MALVCGCALVAGNPRAQFPQSQVIERVSCKADPEQSYALYLPPGYTPEKKWPVLYAFDPAGRGSVPVKFFQEAAAKFGYILVGSNNSRNGIDVSAIVKTLWADTHEQFSIDERRVYTTGFSGGARVASAVALGYRGAVAGVIAASAGLPPNFDPSLANQFVFFGTAGTEDFNFPEMQQTKRKLDEVGVTNRLAIFPGPHDWPPADLCTEAIAWMEMQAMKAGTRAKDDELIEARLNLQKKTAHDFEVSQKSYEAYLQYEDLITEFKGLRDTTEFASAAARLGATKEVKAAIKSEKTEEDDQARLLEKLRTLIARLQDAAIYPETIAELKDDLINLAKQAETSKSVADQRVAQRVLQSLFVQVYEEAFAMKQRKDYAAIPAKLELAAVIRPKDPNVFYSLAVAYARIGNKSRAMAALTMAIERGFSDLARIEQNEDFAILRNEADYKKAVASLKKP